MHTIKFFCNSDSDKRAREETTVSAAVSLLANEIRVWMRVTFGPRRCADGAGGAGGGHNWPACFPYSNSSLHAVRGLQPYVRWEMNKPSWILGMLPVGGETQPGTSLSLWSVCIMNVWYRKWVNLRYNYG